jgi:hypothetical protein
MEARCSPLTIRLLVPYPLTGSSPFVDSLPIRLQPLPCSSIRSLFADNLFPIRLFVLHSLTASSFQRPRE